MRHNRRLTLWLVTLLGLCVLSAGLNAMTPDEQALYDQIHQSVEDCIADANDQAAEDIDLIENTESLGVFISQVKKTNSMMAGVIDDLQPWVDALTALSGIRHEATCEYVHVYNHHLDRSALVDPIHLTSSGD